MAFRGYCGNLPINNKRLTHTQEWKMPKKNLNNKTSLNRLFTALALFLLFGSAGYAADYKVDTSGKHAFIQFKVSHLGFSYVLGDFPDFGGSFSYDTEEPNASKVEINIDTTTVDTRHAKRNVHIRGEDFLNVKKFPTATFTSTSYAEEGGGSGVLTGDLTMHGVTRPVSIQLTKIGEGKDPWGSYRAGFEGTTTLTMADFGIDYNLGPSSRDVEIYFSIEGVRQ
jgi:polyisoprenoid-binding protein YceI